MSRLVKSSLFALFIFCLLDSEDTLAQTRIGLSLPITGTYELLGKQFLAGAQFKLAQYNANAAEKIELAVSDDRCDENITKFVSDELLAANVSLVTGVLCNNVAYQLADDLKDKNLPLLIAGARSERLTMDRVRKNWSLWRLAPGDYESAKTAARELAKRWAGKPFAIVDDGTVYGRNLADNFRIAMDELGLKPQFQDNFRPTQSTQARLVRRLQRSGVTHVFVGASAEDVSMIAANSLELDISLDIAGGDILSVLPFLRAEQRPPKPIFAVLAKHEAPDALNDEQLAQFAQNKLDVEPYVLMGYQAMEVALDAAGASPEQTIAALHTRTFDTLLGAVSFDQEGVNTYSAHGLYRWQDGTFKRVSND